MCRAGMCKDALLCYCSLDIFRKDIKCILLNTPACFSRDREMNVVKFQISPTGNFWFCLPTSQFCILMEKNSLFLAIDLCAIYNVYLLICGFYD